MSGTTNTGNGDVRVLVLAHSSSFLPFQALWSDFIKFLAEDIQPVRDLENSALLAELAGQDLALHLAAPTLITEPLRVQPEKQNFPWEFNLGNCYKCWKNHKAKCQVGEAAQGLAENHPYSQGEIQGANWFRARKPQDLGGHAASMRCSPVERGEGSTPTRHPSSCPDSSPSEAMARASGVGPHGHPADLGFEESCHKGQLSGQPEKSGVGGGSRQLKQTISPPRWADRACLTHFRSWDNVYKVPVHNGGSAKVCPPPLSLEPLRLSQAVVTRWPNKLGNVTGENDLRPWDLSTASNHRLF